MIGEQAADVFGDGDVLIDAELQIFCRDFNGNRRVIHFPDGDGKVPDLFLIAIGSTQREGMASHMGLVGRCLENPDGWAAIVKNKQFITVEFDPTCWWRQGWCEMQIDVCISVLLPEP